MVWKNEKYIEFDYSFSFIKIRRLTERETTYFRLYLKQKAINMIIHNKTYLCDYIKS